MKDSHKAACSDENCARFLNLELILAPRRCRNSQPRRPRYSK